MSAIFDCYDLTAIGLAMDDNMRAELCTATVENAAAAYPDFDGAVLHSDRGSQYTSELYRCSLNEFNIRQSMNSAGGRCHDNSRCESRRGQVTRMKNELFYSRGRRSTDYTTEQLKTMIWRYYMSYWNNRRICSAIGWMPSHRKAPQIFFSHGLATGALHWNKYPLRGYLFQCPMFSKFLSELCKGIMTIPKRASKIHNRGALFMHKPRPLR